MAPQDTGRVPRDYEALRALIVERRSTLPKRLAQVAAYAIDSPDDIAFSTAAQIAAKANVQPSTLVRFAQAIGYQGFSDLQDVFRSRLRDRWPDYTERLSTLRRSGQAGSTVTQLLDGLIETGMTSLDRLRTSVPPDVLESAVNKLVRAETIYLLAQRRAFPVASYLAYALSKSGIRNILVDNLASLGPEEIRFAGQKDVVLAVSFTPYSPITVELSEMAADRGVPIVAITDSPFSPLAHSADVTLEVVEDHLGAFRSLSACMCLSMMLAIAVADRRSDPNEPEVGQGR